MVDKNNKNPLEELYTDSGQMDQAALLSILKPYVRLHKDSTTIIYTPTGIGLSAAKKIILLFHSGYICFSLSFSAKLPGKTFCLQIRLSGTCPYWKNERKTGK